MPDVQAVRVWTKQIEVSAGRLENLINAVERGIIPIGYVNWETARADLSLMRKAANELDLISEKTAADDKERICG